MNRINNRWLGNMNQHGRVVVFAALFLTATCLLSAVCVSTASADANTPSLTKGGVYTYTVSPYYPTYAGQCTAYAWGRTYEKLGIKMLASKSPAANLWLTNGWKNKANGQYFAIGAKGQPKSNSIAVWGWIVNGKEVGGHVAFVENVNGNTVTFTESNWDTYKLANGNRGGGYDGYVKSYSLSKFETRPAKEGKYVIKGYIYLSDSPTLVRVTGTQKVYLIDTNGKKAWIPTANVFNSWGWNWNSIKDITQTEFNKYSSATPDKVVFKDGTFIKYNGEISIIENGKRRPFANWQAYLNHGGKQSPTVYDVTAAEYSLNPTGSTIYS